MKKFCIIFLLSIIISLTGFGLIERGLGERSTGESGREYLRIHIRANSNEGEDQALKYLVKDKLVEFLTPIVADSDTFQKAETAVRQRLASIERVATNVLLQKGYSYGARASVRRERFPTRVYGEYVLERGEYLALIVELGKGEGDNWWCVVYPPLCFTAEAEKNVVYKSKIMEIIENFRKDKSS